MKKKRRIKLSPERFLQLILVLLSFVPVFFMFPYSRADLLKTPQKQNMTAYTDLNELQVLDLKTAQKIALAANPSLAAARERVRQAKERVAQARSAYYPRLDALASTSRFWLSENDRQAALQTARLFNPRADIDTSDERYSSGLAANWILFDGFERKFLYSAAHFGEQESRESHMDARRLLLASVATAFFVAQLAREDIAIASADETFNRRQIDEAKARRRVGTGSLSDVLNFEIQVNSARSRLIRAKQLYNVAMIGLATLLGIREARFPPNIELARLERETQEELVAPPPDPQIRYALTHRPDVRRGDYAVKRATSEVGIARAKFYPVLNATGSVDGDRTGSAEFENDDFGGSVGLNLTYNLFAGGLNRAQLAEAKSRLTEAEKNLNDASIQVASEVQEAVAELIAGQEQLMLQRKNASLVQQNRDLVEKEYNAGQASLVRLNEAQRDLTTAQSQLVLALVSLRQSWENLRAVTGEILKPFELDEPFRPTK